MTEYNPITVFFGTLLFITFIFGINSCVEKNSNAQVNLSTCISYDTNHGLITKCQLVEGTSCFLYKDSVSCLKE